MTFAFYRLARNPQIVKKLRDELASFVKKDGDLNIKDFQDNELLNAVINETLRLHPPVPAGTLRVTPDEGLQIGKTFIPGGTTVVSPTYTVGRCESLAPC